MNKRPITPAAKIKLISLHPRWVLDIQWTTPDGVEHSCDNLDSQGRFGMGISFDCPLHAAFNSPPQNRHRITICFANPMDGQPPMRGVPLWLCNGASFKALSASPVLGETHTECWGGVIKNGEIV